MNADKLYQVVYETLKSIPLEDYKSEEKELQPYLKTKISETLESTFPGEYDIKISIGGEKRPRVDLFGTNFWPDIEISKKGKSLLAVEVKLARKSLVKGWGSGLAIKHIRNHRDSRS